MVFPFAFYRCRFFVRGRVADFLERQLPAWLVGQDESRLWAFSIKITQDYPRVGDHNRPLPPTDAPSPPSEGLEYRMPDVFEPPQPHPNLKTIWHNKGRMGHDGRPPHPAFPPSLTSCFRDQAGRHSFGPLRSEDPTSSTSHQTKAICGLFLLFNCIQEMNQLYLLQQV